MTEDNKIKVTSLSITFENGKQVDYHDITNLDIDQKLGFPRLSIVDEKHGISNINLDKVMLWKVITENVH